jgi:predicted transcriptional regulator of viral defense system
VKPRRTEHQREIMGLVLKAANEGTFITQKELAEKLSYASEVTYGAIRISIRFLEEQGMLKRVKDGIHRRLVPLERGYDWFRPARPI